MIGPAGDDPRMADPDRDLALRHVLPVVGRQRQGSDALTLALGAAVVGALGLATFWSMSHGREHPREAVAAPAVVPAPPPAPPAVLTALPPAAITPIDAAPVPPPAAIDPARAASGNPLATPALVYNAAPMVEATVAASDSPPALHAAAKDSANANGGDDFAARVGATGTGAATASSAFAPRTTVAQGTLIPAMLETAIDTDVPGYARAIVSADVRGFDGEKVLIPRTSRLIGQYKSGLQAGQRRVYVIWTRLIRPDGVAVALGSPGTSYSGESGLGGKVDTHFFERFGSAMLLTVMGGLSTIGSGTTNVVIAGGGQSAAAAAVGQTGQIAPTIRIHPGEPIRVFTARDLDFSRVEPAAGTP
jgi:type IV secretion system protein VirB10